MKHYRIALADDHALLRQGLRKIIDEKAGLTVVGDVGDGLALLNLVKKAAPDMVILDISMPNLRGLEAAGEIKRAHPGVKVLILTMHKDVEFLNQAFCAGADGYLLKENADVDLFSAIERIRSGKRYVPPELSDELTENWARRFRKDQGPSFDPGPLTAREREVLKMTAEGRTAKEIAELLFISSRTVEHHRANIMNKLNLKKATDIVKYAMHNRYI
ncbi:MAG: response regulator transcription factor [Nitrospirota bacterium]